MGQRANIIFVTKDSYELYYNHWCGNTIYRDLFWGVEHALSFIKEQKKVDKENGWLNEAWAEGGAVVDTHRKVLLIYAGEDLRYEIPLRRMYLKLLAQVWKGWDIRWANEGIADLAEYVGYPKESLLEEYEEEECNPSFDMPLEKDDMDVIGSVTFDKNETLIFPLHGYAEEYLFNGKESLNAINRSNGHKELKLLEWNTNFPVGGFHIDVVNRSVSFWTATDCPGLLYKLKPKWTGWKLNWAYDKFETQIEALNKKIDFYIPTEESLLNRLRSMLLQEYKNRIDLCLLFADRMAKGGKKVEVNPWLLESKTLNMDKNIKEHIFDSLELFS
ncbi:hypothetical protein [Clostridium beijerinckii]|uniref:Uncharacterized protein n=1 Tax=Clostridium beijerinckii TaxID=1520 RepID=A0AAE5LQF0_CLOBE|nr:hypothetical protein [Clostridium beijerinckii]NSB14524.1 hypothetical protein [Clostridium beijerinckii]OOM27611.1 hypothetical protein CLOBE_29590 [Clostridium beijerinckii]